MMEIFTDRISLYESTLKKLFEEGLNTKEIAAAVGAELNIWRSDRTTRRHLNRLGLLAKGVDNVSEKAVEAIKALMCQGAIGANSIWRSLRRMQNIHIKRQTVRDVIELLDPGRSARLKKGRLSRRIYKVKGPNHIWHMDGNDKLKPYGFAIHGCIDGYSRKLLWLNVCSTNKDPTVVLNYYMKAVCDEHVVPSILRCDRGTENFLTGDIQMLFRSEHDDELRSCATIYGRSSHNQRIECFWSYLLKMFLQDYIDLFKDLESVGLIDRSDAFVMNALSFSFMDIVRLQLNQIRLAWNSHRLRGNRLSELPAGAPNFLFKHPAFHGFVNMRKPVDIKYVSECLTKCHPDPVMALDHDFYEWALNVMLEKTWFLPTTQMEAIDLFGNLLTLKSNYQH